MSELPPSALTMKPQDGVHQNMSLELQNYNNFLTSSSTYSSSSSSSSPDSTYTLSSLDVKLPEGMSVGKTTTNDDDSGIQSPDFRPEDNDNSVSIYLDANEEGWHVECDVQENVSIIQNHESDDVFRDASVDGEQARRGSADSSATEAQLFAPENEDGGDEDEDSFLSVRSADVVMWKPSELEQAQMCEQDFVGSMIDLHKEAFQDSEDHPNEEGQMCSSTNWPSLGPAAEVHQEAFQDSEDHSNEEGQLCSLTISPSVSPLSMVHQEAFQDSVVPYIEVDQISRLVMKPILGLVSELHQETSQDSVNHFNEKGQMCSLTIKPSVAFVSTVHQEAFQDSVVSTNEEGQISNSAMGPSVSLVSELHQEASKVISRSIMQRATKETDVDPGSELHHKVHQKTMELHKKQEQVECSNTEFHKEENQIHTSAKRPNMDLVSEIHQEAVQTNIDLATEKSHYQPHETMSPSVFQTAPPSTTIQNMKDPPCFPTRNISQNTTDPPAPSHTRSPTEPLKFKSTKVKRFSRPILKDIKPEVMSRAASTPRPVITGHSHWTACCKTNSLTTRSRAAKRTEQGDDGGRNRASSTQARSTTPPTISDSNSKSTCLPVVKEQTPDVLGSKVVTNGRTASLKVTATSREERDSYKEEVVVKEDTRDGDEDQNVSSDLRPSVVGTRVPRQGCVSAAVRGAPLSSVPKMRVIDSNSTVSGSAYSWKAPLKSASSKLPIKSGGLPTSLSSSLVGSTTSENKGVAQVMKSEETFGRPSSSSQEKSASTKPAAGIRNRANPPAKPNTAGQKATAHVIQTKTTQNALHRGGSGRPGRNSASVCPSSRGPRGTRPAQTHAEVEEEKKNCSNLQLRSLVAHGNRRLEALAVVVQHIFNEREEALKQKKETSIQLKNLREELAQSVLHSERLECEKASVCAQLDATVLSLQQQHRVELAQLEDRLRDFYSVEWDKAHQIYQEEADRCTALMRQQVEEVRSKQEALRTEQEVTHGRQIEELRQGYQATITELKKSHERDRKELDNTLKSSEAALNERIASLMKENEALRERLRDTEEKRRALAHKNQRDSRVVYLEQELESLKVVLDIKTNQLHQQDKKLMQMDKLMESNVKLEEFVTKLQQENEDYRARMDKHAELSRQLSTEQVTLQQTLQKESKANKRLSMENEELLWKLHNGLSPRNSASFPSSPISPR